MNSTPFVGVSTTTEGETYVLLRQSASDGQYAVDICLTMEQFSCLMGVLRGLEMYFMDMELRKPDYLLSASLIEEQASTVGDASSASTDVGTQTSKTTRKRKREQANPEEKKH